MSKKPSEGVEPEPLFDDLSQVHSRTWELLSEAAVDRLSPMHTPVVATIASDGSPRVRTVVLRKVDAAGRMLVFHTDTRSIKIEELRKDSRISLHTYDAPRRTQIRIEGVATIHTDDRFAQVQWDASQPMSRECYRIPVAPGTPMPKPMTSEIWLAEGRINFAAVVIEARVVEWLLLHHQQHRRARFEYEPGGETFTKAEWLGP